MRYLVNGLIVECDIPLAHGRLDTSGSEPDLRIVHAGERTVPPTPAEGVILQGLAAPGRLLCTTVRRPGGDVLVRLHGMTDFEVAADTRSVQAWNDPRCDREMLAIFAAGHLQAVILALRGETVLHASAVEVDDGAIAFVADSGTGKSTLAALACARGARFITDDVLRWCATEDGAVHGWPGATENRLRRGFADVFVPGATTRTSSDGRTVWTPPVTTSAMCRVEAVILPRPERHSDRLDIRRLPAGAALVELSRRPRILGWSDERILAQEFSNLSELVRRVPVFVARVPWGPPFDDTVIDALLTCCRAPRLTSHPAA